jgi:ribosomal protein S18 acetylase RimI-like enzyme
MASEPTIRPAAAADLPALAALDEQLLGGESWALALWEQELGGLGRILLVAADDEELLGYAIVLLAGDVADLLRIGVRPDHRRAGLAGRMLTEVVESAVAAGSRRMLLEVSDRNAGAAAFYASRGFVEIDRRLRYYRDGSDARVLALELPT